MKLFEASWRWYGPHDPVSLSYIQQAGATGIVNALHQIPVGEVWSLADIQERKQLIERQSRPGAPLQWVVVESLPVHDSIKRGVPERDHYIENYRQSIRHLAQAGVKTICYNFMPVLDWVRTELNYELPEGAHSLLFDPVDLAIFDRYYLQLPGVAQRYDAALLDQAAKRFAQMSPGARQKLQNAVLLGLPGSQEQFRLESLRQDIQAYADMGREQLRENLLYFLRAVVPLAEETGVKLAIHPDDPPFSVLGLPRIVSTEEDIAALLRGVDSPANGLTFCSGSLGAEPANDMVSIIERWIHRIYFVHLRSVQRQADGSFYEARHLEGDGDLFSLVQTFAEQQTRFASPTLPMRPDHGHRMLDDLHKEFYPGYSAIGRLKALAELRGLEMVCLRFR